MSKDEGAPGSLELAGSQQTPEPRGEQRPEIAGRVAKWSAGILFVSTLAEALGKAIGRFENLYIAVSKILPQGQFFSIHQWVVPVVRVALIASYIGVAVWLWTYLRKTRSHWQKQVLAYTGLVAAAFVSYVLLPAHRDYVGPARIERQAWANRVLEYPTSTGGVPVLPFPDSDPQVWTTAQALRGALGSSTQLSSDQLERIRKGFEFMENARLGQGWGYFENWPFGVTEINAWVALAEIASLRRDVWTESEQRDTMRARVIRDLETIVATKQNDGGWSPVFGEGQSLSRTYSTIMALWALIDAKTIPRLRHDLGDKYDNAIRGGFGWMMMKYEEPHDGRPVGWVANPFRGGQQEHFAGLNAQALYVLTLIAHDETFKELPKTFNAYEHAVTSFLDNLASDADIGRNDRLHDTDRYIRIDHALPHSSSRTMGCACPVTVEASTFLWFPWSLKAAAELSKNLPEGLDDVQKRRATAAVADLMARLPDATSFVRSSLLNYIAAEFLISFDSL
jgi:hypothetical protein